MTIGWATQQDWEDATKTNIEVVNDTFQLADVIPDSGNLQANHDARAVSVPNGSVLDPWQDEENANDMAATGGPTYNDTGLNSQPTVTLDIDDYYRDGDILGQQQSIYCVIDQQNSTGLHTAISTYQVFSNNVEGMWLWWDAGGGQINGQTGDGTNASTTSLTFDLDDGNPHIIAFCFDMDAGSQVVRANSSEATSSPAPLTVAHGNYEFGRIEESNTRYWDDDISHVLTYDTFHDATTRDEVVSHLQNEWGL